MKKTMIMLVAAFLLAGIGTFNKTRTNINDAVVRSAGPELEGMDGFDSFDEEREEGLYRALAKKRVSRKSLLGYETVSLGESDTYVISYEVVADTQSEMVRLDVFFDDGGESIVEDFTGIPMKNHEDEDDILFCIDGERIFLSELSEMLEGERCSWLGNIVHGAINAGLLAAEILEPMVRFLVRTSGDVRLLFLSVATPQTTWQTMPSTPTKSSHPVTCTTSATIHRGLSGPAPTSPMPDVP